MMMSQRWEGLSGMELAHYTRCFRFSGWLGWMGEACWLYGYPSFHLVLFLR